MKSRAPLLELTLFVDDLDSSVAFFRALGFHVERWPGAESTTADVTLGSLDAPLVQLFQANETHPATRCQLGFQVVDLSAVTAALDEAGMRWSPGGTRIRTWDPDGNTVHVSPQPAVASE